MKKTLCLFLSLFLMTGLCACVEKGEPDQTGSWGQINQKIARPDNWKQIVEKSSFQLGEKKLVETWQGEDGPEEYYELGYGTYPSIDGSTVCVPMAIEFARQHLGMNDQDAGMFVNFNTTDIAYENLINKGTSTGYVNLIDTSLEEKVVDIILVTEPSDEELAMAKKNNVELVLEPVCFDAFVFIVHKDNPVNSLTVEQIQKIYSGDISNWKEVGGQNKKIHPYQREENSGSQTTMEKQVMQGKKMLPPNTVNVVRGMGELVETVGEYENSLSSIGYTFKYYIDTLYKNENIKVLEVEGIEPSTENMQNKAYPFTTNYFGVIRAEDQEKAGGRFLSWMLSEEGRNCIEQAGYCPLKDR